MPATTRLLWPVMVTTNTSLVEVCRLSYASFAYIWKVVTLPAVDAERPLPDAREPLPVDMSAADVGPETDPEHWLVRSTRHI